MGLYCLSGAALNKAGLNRSLSGANVVDEYILQAESIINVATKKNWSDTYSSLNVDVKYVLEHAAACLAAIEVINYDMSGYTSRSEAETMCDVLWTSYLRDVKILEDINSRDFMTGA
jgi:hypothetical protein